MITGRKIVKSGGIVRVVPQCFEQQLTPAHLSAVKKSDALSGANDAYQAAKSARIVWAVSQRFEVQLALAHRSAVGDLYTLRVGERQRQLNEGCGISRVSLQ